MCSHCIIGKGVTFFAEVKVAFAHLEEHLYVPTFSVDPDDFTILYNINHNGAEET